MKDILVVGKGVSGRSAAYYLKKQGYSVKMIDDDDIALCDGNKQEFISRLLEGLLFVVTSPGISPNNEVVKEARKRGLKVVGEFELGCSESKGDIIAVTGTNGKTTTVSLINFLLDGQKRKVFLGGNIGTPVTSFAKKTQNSDILVLECSSFQLNDVNSFKPHIAAILNITVDHLSWHGTMENYIRAKCNIAKCQDGDDFLLINADDRLLMENLPRTKAKIYYFSTKEKVVGCYIKNRCIYFNDNHHEIKLAAIRDIKLLGEHNLSNILCAVLSVWLETGEIKLFKRLPEFKGVSHRIEYVKTINGVAIYNDSKATNIDSTLVALKSFKQKINLILGGSDKGYEYDQLFDSLPKNVKSIVVTGETKDKIICSAKNCNFSNIFIENSFKNAVLRCFELSCPNEVMLLSPASASFDCFKNYEERGNYFKKIIEEISLNENVLDKCKEEI